MAGRWRIRRCWHFDDQSLTRSTGGGLIEVATLARRISFQDSLIFEQVHEQTYRDLGFHLVEVPAGPLTDRIARIQQTIKQLRR